MTTTPKTAQDAPGSTDKQVGPFYPGGLDERGRFNVAAWIDRLKGIHGDWMAEYAVSRGWKGQP